VDDVLAALRQRRGVPLGPGAVAAAFAAVEGDIVVAEGVKEADRVRAPADAGDTGVGQVPGPFEQPFPASSPMTDWNSRTIRGNGSGPTTDPTR
jgi:hypothetical protein